MLFEIWTSLLKLTDKAMTTRAARETKAAETLNEEMEKKALEEHVSPQEVRY